MAARSSESAPSASPRSASGSPRPAPLRGLRRRPSRRPRRPCRLSAAQIAYFFVYFILGYAFYSSIAAALGAMTNSEQELQQLNMFLVLPLSSASPP